MRRAALGLLVLATACARHASLPPPAGPPEPPRPGVTVTLRWTAAVDLDLYVTDPALETVYFANPRTASGGYTLLVEVDGVRQELTGRARLAERQPLVLEFRVAAPTAREVR